jgi:hypothetical protein
MRTLYTTLVLSLLVLSVVSLIPGVLAVEIGTGVTPDITVEKFPPRVWMCDERVVVDDNTEPGRKDGREVCYKNSCPEVKGLELIERLNNYAFEGEKIEWIVLVMDKNKIDQNIDVYGTVGSSQGPGNDIEVNCKRIDKPSSTFEKCNARIEEEQLEWDEETMAFFECTLTVETAESMHGEFWVTVEAQDSDGLMGTMDENEYWFFNPIIALSVDGTLTFTDVRPGTDSYSSTLLIGNEAEAGSGVLLDMFISGTDFYDSSSSGARCPSTNQLSLGAFRYFATSGAYSSTGDAGVDIPPGRGDRNNDVEGYTNIGYGIGFNNPDPFYDAFEILQDGETTTGPLAGYYLANILAPGAEMALTFKLSLPEPCNGDFDTGSIFFWGEAI